MRAQTHVWLADQAIKILSRRPDAAALAELLRAHPKEMWLGSSWLPDVCFGDVETAHVCRTLTVSVDDPLPARVDELFRSAVAHTVHQATPYPDAQTALAFFVLGHYVADANCPPHTDPRIATGGTIPPALHHELEDAWEAWFCDGPDGAPALIMNGDSPLSIVGPTAGAEFAKLAGVDGRVTDMTVAPIERSRSLALAQIPDRCRGIADLRESLGSLGVQMLATEVFSRSVADIARLWHLAWTRATNPKAAEVEA